MQHEVIAFKSCYPASDITSDKQLEERKDWYRKMRDYDGSTSRQAIHRHDATTAESGGDQLQKPLRALELSPTG